MEMRFNEECNELIGRVLARDCKWIKGRVFGEN